MLAITRWILRGILGRALAWVLLFAFLAGPLLGNALDPLPVSGRAALAAALAWTHPAALIGVSLALISLSKGAEFLARVPPRTRWSGELVALTAAATYLQLPIVLAACATGVTPVDLSLALPAILVLDLRLAATALLLLVPPLSTTLRVALFLAAAWLVPALAAASPGLARATAWLDAGADLSASALPSAAVVAAALILPGYLLRTTRISACGARSNAR